MKSEVLPHIAILTDICKSDKDNEELWVSVSKPGNKKIFLGVVYRPPSGIPVFPIKT